MKQALLPILIVVGVAAAAANAVGLRADENAKLTSSSIVIVSGTSDVSATPLTLTDLQLPATAVRCDALTASSGTTDPAPGTRGCGLRSQVTLQDRVWFGTYWQLLRTPVVLDGGFINARIERTNDGDFFNGIVEKANPSGQVTDVILAFAGSQGADAVQGESILLGLPLDEARRATDVYERLLSDPRYASARIHVTGHSLGAGYTQYVLAYALARHGAAATDARADFLGFGAPNWLTSAAAHFGVDPVLAGERMVDFTAANDPVLLNGVVRSGLNNYLPAFLGLSGLGAAFNVIAAHYPTTYAAALGLPDWLSAADKAAATAALSAQFQTGNSISPDYGPAGRLPLVIDGSAGAEWLQGLSGNDRLIGHDGADVLTGGAGADTFAYAACDDSGGSVSGVDRITDFSQAEGDRIDVSRLSLLRPLVFIGAGAFTAAGQVRAVYDGGDTLVEVNLDGDTSLDMVIRLSGRVPLTAADFKLSLA